MQLEILKLLKSYGENIASSSHYSEIAKRSIELSNAGFGIADAMHVAYAETRRADFITCDDDLLLKCRRHNVKIWYGTPVDFSRKEGLL